MMTIPSRNVNFSSSARSNKCLAYEQLKLENQESPSVVFVEPTALIRKGTIPAAETSSSGT
jgi:hypothetical protein